MRNRIILMAIGLMVVTAGVVNAAPGDTNDPLVSKSYVDNRINELLGITTPTTTSGTTNVVSTDIDKVADEVIKRLEYVLPKSTDDKINYVPVYATKGQTVVGGEGSEVILRSGTGVGYCTGINGMVNMTTGGEIFSGDPVSINNLIIVPRDDGRGVTVTSTEAWFIVRGGYVVLN